MPPSRRTGRRAREWNRSGHAPGANADDLADLPVQRAAAAAYARGALILPRFGATLPQPDEHGGLTYADNAEHSETASPGL